MTKKKVELEKEIEMLNNLISIAQPEDWDLEGVYEDIRDGTFNGNYIDGNPDEEFAKWFKLRFSLDV